MIYGKSILQNDEECCIRIKPPVPHWEPIVKDTLGIEYTIPGTPVIKVYTGDIVKYTFSEQNTLYSKYFIVKTTETGVCLEEAWRDYKLNPETFTISRFDNFENKGTQCDLKLQRYGTFCKVIGNIWENPELAKI
jgi:hypothetical protein